MLRECPIDHRCMKRIDVDAVQDSVRRHLAGPTAMRPAVFLDRDGTIIEESGYLDRLERLVFFPFSVDAVRVLNRAGFAVVVVTNQAGIARGIVRESFVAEAHRHIAERLEAGGARIDGFYFCPHYPTGVVARVPHGVRLPQAAAGAVAAGGGRSRSRSGAVVRRRRSLARPGGGAGGRRARRARAHRPGLKGRSGARRGGRRPRRSSTT